MSKLVTAGEAASTALAEIASGGYRPPKVVSKELIDRAATYLANRASEALRGALMPVARAGDAVGVYPLATREVVDEAHRRLAAVRTMLCRPSPGIVVNWLCELNGNCLKRHTGDSLRANVDHAARYLDLPAICFTPVTIMPVLRKLMPHFEDGGTNGVFPGTALLEALLLPYARDAQREERALVALLARANVGPKPAAVPAVPDRSVDRLDAAEVRTRLAAWRAAPRDRWTRLLIESYAARLRREAPALAAEFSADISRLLDFPAPPVESMPPRHADVTLKGPLLAALRAGRTPPPSGAIPASREQQMRRGAS